MGIESALADTARAHGDQVALIDGADQQTYVELGARVDDFAAQLTSAGVVAGDRVALLQRKTLESVAALYATWRVGAIAVPTSVELRGPQLAHVLVSSGARLVVASEREQALLDDAAAVDANARLPRIDPDDVPSATPATYAPREGHEPAALLYTSGSTGLSKGILISHDNLVAGARIVSKYLGITGRDRLLSVLPFHFDYGLNQLLTTVLHGATLVLQRSTMPGAIIRTLEEERITGLAGVPPLWVQLMMTGSPLPKTALPELRYITNSGGAFPVPLLRRYREVMPHVSIYLMYGLSEAFRSSYLPPDEVDEKPTAMGRPIPETELLVLDPEGAECPPGVPGELVHRGPTVALGYWNDPQATAEVFRPDPADPNGRVVFSGDIVRREADGTLYYVGRRDQRMKCFGHRVSPEEVEAALAPIATEAIVGAVPDDVAGERVVAHLVLRDGVDEAAAWAHCRSVLPRYMQPIRITVHESFPRTSSGKVARSQVLGRRSS